MVSRDLSSSKLVLLLSFAELKSDVMVATENKYYGNVNTSNGQATDQSTSSIVSPLDPTPYAFPTKLKNKPPKGVIHKSRFILRVRATHNYNAVEDLTQAPLAMSTLEVLQNYSTQKDYFLSAIGCGDPLDFDLVVFNHANYMPRLPTQIYFMIQVVIHGNNIHCSIVDEGAST